MADILFLYYPKCTTCQKAEKWLKEHNISFTPRHIVTSNPSYEELEQWYAKSGLPLKNFFNTSGLVYKSLKLKDRLSQMNTKEQLHLLSSDGMLVKRPLIVGENFVLIGFKEKQWQEKLL